MESRGRDNYLAIPGASTTSSTTCSDVIRRRETWTGSGISLAIARSFGGYRRYGYGRSSRLWARNRDLLYRSINLRGAFRKMTSDRDLCSIWYTHSTYTTLSTASSMLSGGHLHSYNAYVSLKRNLQITTLILPQGVAAAGCICSLPSQGTRVKYCHSRYLFRGFKSAGVALWQKDMLQCPPVLRTIHQLIDLSASHP